MRVVGYNNERVRGLMGVVGCNNERVQCLMEINESVLCEETMEHDDLTILIFKIVSAK